MKATVLFSVFAAISISLTGFASDPPTTAGAPNPEMMKLMQPGDNHKHLTPMVGKWNFTLKYWMTPDGKPEETKGTSTSKWVMGGRFIQSEAKAKMGKQKFEGMGFTGYDNVKGEYQTVWFDNMSTGMMRGTGAFDATTKTMTETGEFGCAMTGNKNRWYRTEMKMTSPKEMTYTMYNKTTDDKEYKSMEITYTKKAR